MKNAVRRFHQDEAGLEALQVVMIVAIAAIVLITVKTKYPEIRDWFIAKVDDIMQFES
jgi:Flp pilus assembly pilin Flp